VAPVFCFVFFFFVFFFFFFFVFVFVFVFFFFFLSSFSEPSSVLFRHSVSSAASEGMSAHPDTMGGDCAVFHRGLHHVSSGLHYVALQWPSCRV
jgi:hypothetical protein